MSFERTAMPHFRSFCVSWRCVFCALTTRIQPVCRSVEEVERTLVLYYKAVDTVPASEQELLLQLLTELESSLDPGFSVLNWNSLGITEFVQQCRKAISDFNTRIGQVLKNKKDIEALVAAMSQASLLPELPDDKDVPSLQVCNTSSSRLLAPSSACYYCSILQVDSHAVLLHTQSDTAPLH